MIENHLTQTGNNPDKIFNFLVNLNKKIVNEKLQIYGISEENRTVEDNSNGHMMKECSTSIFRNGSRSVNRFKNRNLFRDKIKKRFNIKA